MRPNDDDSQRGRNRPQMYDTVYCKQLPWQGARVLDMMRSYLVAYAVLQLRRVDHLRLGAFTKLLDIQTNFKVIDCEFQRRSPLV